MHISAPSIAMCNAKFHPPSQSCNATSRRGGSKLIAAPRTDILLFGIGAFALGIGLLWLTLGFCYCRWSPCCGLWRDYFYCCIQGRRQWTRRVHAGQKEQPAGGEAAAGNQHCAHPFGQCVAPRPLLLFLSMPKIRQPRREHEVPEENNALIKLDGPGESSPQKDTAGTSSQDIVATPKPSSLRLQSLFDATARDGNQHLGPEAIAKADSVKMAAAPALPEALFGGSLQWDLSLHTQTSVALSQVSIATTTDGSGSFNTNDSAFLLASTTIAAAAAIQHHSKSSDFGHARDDHTASAESAAVCHTGHDSALSATPSSMGSKSAMTSSRGQDSRGAGDGATTPNHDDTVTAATPLEVVRQSTTRNRAFTADQSAASYGTTINESHANFVLMHDMLMGIRTAVSRCQAKPARELTVGDFKAASKLTFDLAGSVLTPSSRYEFKFKDYSPWVFRSLRETFHIDAAEYLVSLTGKYVLSELYSPGKSGSLFYYSQDYRFILKTIKPPEHVLLRKILPYYYEHVHKNTNSLLVRFFGLHRVRLPHERKVYFVVMGNVFPPHNDMHEVFDLKGSTFGRFAPENQRSGPNQTGPVILKDVNWIKGNRRLRLGPVKATLLMNQLKSDCQFLSKLKIMDYSLLVGIHVLSRGNSTDNGALEKEKTAASSSYTHRPVAIARTTASSSQASGTDSKLVPLERRMCVFYADDGGFRSTYQDDSDANEIYYLGIIDILTPYTIAKKLEHAFKSIQHNSAEISAINPLDYAKRFLKFMADNILQDCAADYGNKFLPNIPEAQQMDFDGDSVLVKYDSCASETEDAEEKETTTDTDNNNNSIGDAAGS